MLHNDAVFTVSALVVEATALSEAIRDGDLQEGRFRAKVVEAASLDLNLTAIHLIACSVVERLGGPGDMPRNGAARAVQALHKSLDAAMARLQL